MPKRVQLPDGSVGEFPDDMSDSAIESVLVKQFSPAGLTENAQGFRIGDTSKAPGYVEQALGGAKHGLDRLAYGLKGLFTDLSPEDKQLLQQGSAFVKETGPASTAGELAGEILPTMPLSGPVALGGKVLSKAVPALKALGSVGGRIFNTGLVGRGAVEGALQAGALAPNEGDTRSGNIAAGAAMGSALPLAGVAGQYLPRALTMVAPTTASTTQRAGRALENTLGTAQLSNLKGQLTNATPTRLPQTTAALLDDPKLGLLERGARARGNADFAGHDIEVGRRAWDLLQDDTVDAAKAALYAGRPAKIQGAVTNVLEGATFPSNYRAMLSRDFADLGTMDEAIANPAVKRTLNQLSAIVEDPNASPAVLTELQRRLTPLAQKSPVLQKAHALLGDTADMVSRSNVVSRGEQALREQTQKLTQANAEKAIREVFMSPEGMPKTPTTVPTDVGPVPRVTAGPLRRAIASQEAKLNPTARSDLATTADELRRHEIYKAAPDVGVPDIDLGTVRTPAMAALSATHNWALRGGLDVLYARADKPTRAMIDQALLDPNKFLTILNKYKAAGTPLSPVEKALEQTILAGSRAGAATATGD